MESFRKLKLETTCPFAKSAKVWFGPCWDHSSDWSENIRAQAADLLRFSETAEIGGYHGYAAQIGLGSAARDFESVRRGFGRYLLALSETDASCAACMRGDFETLGWQFEYAGTRMFLNVFAPCYPARHSKRVDDFENFFVFFQPEFSFDLCGVNSDRPTIKRQIRSLFAQAGTPYNGEQIDSRFEALLYMFPHEPFGPPVRWWKA